MNNRFPGRVFRLPPRPQQLGELPSTPLDDNGALALNPPIGRPPNGRDYAALASPGAGSVALSANQSFWQSVIFTVGTTPLKIQDSLARKFLLIQNNSAANTIYVGFGWQPTALNSLVLQAGFGYEPFAYPVNEIWVTGSAAGSVGVMIFGT